MSWGGGSERWNNNNVSEGVIRFFFCFAVIFCGVGVFKIETLYQNPIQMPDVATVGRQATSIFLLNIRHRGDT